MAHPKFYLFDTGVARQLGGTAHLRLHPEERDALLETFVLHELRAYLHYSALEYPIAYWQVHGGAEVDFVVETREGLVGIEVKSGARWDARFGAGIRSLHDRMRDDRLTAFGVYGGARALVMDGARAHLLRDRAREAWRDPVRENDPGRPSRRRSLTRVRANVRESRDAGAASRPAAILALAIKALDGEMAARRKEWTPAIADLREAVALEDLARFPGNGWSLLGLERALRLRGKASEAADVAARFAIAWSDADVKIAASCLCREARCRGEPTSAPETRSCAAASAHRGCADPGATSPARRAGAGHAPHRPSAGSPRVAHG